MFDVKDIVVKFDAEFDDVEDSGYVQRLTMIEDLSFFFGGIECVRHEIRNMKDEGYNIFPLIIYYENVLLCKNIIYRSIWQSSQIILSD